jgi:hypothetical protein
VGNISLTISQESEPVNTRWQSGIVRWIGGVVRKRVGRAMPPKLVPYAIRLVLLIFVSVVRSWSQSSGPTESQVKAAYLFHFGKFVRWQADKSASQDSFQICVLGKDPFGNVLDATVSDESIGGKKITIAKPANIQETTTCSVLFISSSEDSRLAPILAAAQRSSVLTVSDIPHFAERGGIIGLVAQQNKIRFEVNRLAAQQSQLSLSSELLKVAMKVIEQPVPGT